jgi:hypothetical protein
LGKCAGIQSKSSGVYFARAKIGGKLIRQSLKTDVLTVIIAFGKHCSSLSLAVMKEITAADCLDWRMEFANIIQPLASMGLFLSCVGFSKLWPEGLQ